MISIHSHSHSPSLSLSLPLSLPLSLSLSLSVSLSLFQSPGNSGPKSPTDEQEHHSNTNNNTYDQLDALQSSNTYEQPDIALRLGSITSPDPMYQEPGTLMLPPSTPGGRSRSKSPSHLNSLYSEPLDSAQVTHDNCIY